MEFIPLIFAAIICTGTACAETTVTCTLKAVIHTRFGVLVNCVESFPDKTANINSNVNFFAPDARLTKNDVGIAPELTAAQTMAGFEAIALEAFRLQRPLVITFTPGMGPGRLFDCWNENCRLASSWSVGR